VIYAKDARDKARGAVASLDAPKELRQQFAMPRHGCEEVLDLIMLERVAPPIPYLEARSVRTVR
jgi:hypothetical protein